jgi:mRNA-degrading endonuclease RelE of RelBE toxin-antitoxin system
MYQLKDLPKFERQYKKFYPKEQELIRKELRKIRANPLIGELKKGSLSTVRVHKFKIHHQLYLLAYEQGSKEKIIYLYAIGTHESFYEGLKRYKDTIGG